jgi:hypothetical protein
MVGLSNAGFLTADTFAAFQRQGAGAFEALKAGGLNTNEALQQMAPFLQSAIDASQNFGVELDENTRSLIAQAEASGIAFEVDPMVQMADTLVVIAELLGATSEQLAGIGSTGAAAADQITTGLGGTTSALDQLDAASNRAFAREQFDGIFEGTDELQERFNRIEEKGGLIASVVDVDEGRARIAEFEAAVVNMDISALTEIGEEGGAIGKLAEQALEQLPAVQEQLVGMGTAASEAMSGVGDEIANLPTVADESVVGIADSFATGTEAITTGLDPVAEKMATEIREAGESTSQAIDQSFDSTNEAIKSGLGQVAATFGGEVVQGALSAASAADKITEAANAAARAAASIEFPDFPGGDDFGGSERSSASGFRGLLRNTTRFTAHAGELVNIIPAGVTNSLRAKRSQPSSVSAQSGFGGISIEMGGLQLAINAPVERGEDGQERIGMTRRELQTAMREIIDNDLGGMVTDSIREQLFEQT